jgi:uridine kinase
MILLLHGLSRSGKDTVANRLASSFEFEHLKISAHLKRSAAMLFGIPERHFEEEDKDLPHPKWGRTPRQILKFLGTDVFQFQIETLLPGSARRFWIDYLHDDIARLQSMKKNVVISDYRFPHELHSLRTRFPTEPIHVIRVTPEYPGYRAPRELDESEQTLPHDFVIRNRTIEELHRDVELLAERLTRKRSPPSR